jgi:hypothetical protein
MRMALAVFLSSLLRQMVSRMERLGPRRKTAYRESGTDRVNPTPMTLAKSANRK